MTPRHPEAAPGPVPSHVDKIEHWLDQAFRLPGTRYRFGLDGLLGLVPGVGDTATALISGAIIADAVRIGARKRTVAAMARNVAVDWAVGLIPLVGDLFDFAHKANTKNVRLLRSEYERFGAAPAGPASSRSASPSGVR